MDAVLFVKNVTKVSILLITVNFTLNFIFNCFLFFQSQAESPSEENLSVTSPTNAPATETPPTKAESAIAALEAVPTPNVKAAAENPEEKPADLVVEGQSLESSA